MTNTQIDEKMFHLTKEMLSKTIVRYDDHLSSEFFFLLYYPNW